jgi:uncharacterized protein (TIGR03066 family)
MRLLALAALAATVGTASAAPVPKAPDKPPALKIVGTWTMTKSSNGAEKRYTATVTFKADGTLSLKRVVPGQAAPPSESVGVYKLDGDKLRYAFGDGATLDAGASVDEVKSLTDDTLVVVDEAGTREEYTREKPGKK